MRPDWDTYFLEIASSVSARSTCSRAFVGTVLVRDKRILSTGFNGAPSGLPHCDEVGHLMVNNHCVRTIHAEANAIIQCALHGVSTLGATCYVTHLPCFSCAKMLVNSGIKRVVFKEMYRPDEHVIEIFKSSGVELNKLANDDGNV